MKKYEEINMTKFKRKFSNWQSIIGVLETCLHEFIFYFQWTERITRMLLPSWIPSNILIIIYIYWGRVTLQPIIKLPLHWSDLVRWWKYNLHHRRVIVTTKKCNQRIGIKTTFEFNHMCFAFDKSFLPDKRVRRSRCNINKKWNN